VPPPPGSPPRRARAMLLRAGLFCTHTDGVFVGVVVFVEEYIVPSP